MKRNIILIGTIISLLLMWSCKDDKVPNLTLESDKLEIIHDGGVFTIPVQCNATSKAVISYDSPDQSGWIFMLPSVLYGDGILELRVDPYTNIWADRTATMTITAEGEVKTIAITQLAKPALNLIPGNISTTYTANTFTISVESKDDWTVSVNTEAASWCTITNGIGNGVGEFLVNAEEMTSGDLRKAVITISTSELEETLILQQGNGVEIDGLIWAHSNVGDPNNFAVSPGSPGLLYQYDSKIGYPNSTPNTSGAPAGYSPTGWFDSGSPWKEENNPSPAGWRIPTQEEIQALINKGFSWVTPEVSGFATPGVFIGIPSSEAHLATKDNTRGGIFLPRTGFRENEQGKQDNWWDVCITSISRPGQNWDRITFHIDYQNNTWQPWAPNAAAYPVRCVKDVE